MRRPWWWPLLAVGALAALGLAVFGGQDRTADEPPAAPAPPSAEEIEFPMPEPDPADDPIEQARGIYSLSGPSMRIVLDLQRGRRFVFTTTAPGFGRREGRGTWSLAGGRLTLAYTSITGKPEITSENPYVVVNKWYGRSIELEETGRQERVILLKQTAIRDR